MAATAHPPTLPPQRLLDLALPVPSNEPTAPETGSSTMPLPPLTFQLLSQQQGASPPVVTGGMNSPSSTLSPAASKPPTGIVKVGFYEVERTIGKGNYAVVKLARHRITKTEVFTYRIGYQSTL